MNNHTRSAVDFAAGCHHYFVPCTFHNSFKHFHYEFCRITIHFAFCTIRNASQCAFFPISLCTILYVLCTMPFPPTFLLSTMLFCFVLRTIHYALCTFQYTLCTMRFALFNIHYARCTIYYALVTIPNALCALRLHYTIPEPTHVGTSFMFSASLVFLAILVLLTACRAPHCVGYFFFVF